MARAMPKEFGAFLETPERLKRTKSVAASMTATGINPLPAEPTGYLAFAPAVRQQEPSPECVGFACHYSIETQLRILFGTCPELSPQYIYNRAKEIDGAPTARGTWPTAAAQALQQWGTVREQDYPFDPALANTPIPAGVPVETEYRISGYTADAYDKDRFLAALPCFGPPVIVTAVTNSLWLAPGGMVDYDPNDTAIGGYHALAILAHDPATARYTALGSWGADQGDHGLSYISEEFAQHYWSMFLTMTPDISQKLVGDENADDRLTVADVVLSLNAAVSRGHYTDATKRLWDVNGDGKINVADAVTLLRRVVSGMKG